MHGAPRSGHGRPGRRAWCQGALAALMVGGLLLVLLGAVRVATSERADCSTTPRTECSACLVRTIPPAGLGAGTDVDGWNAHGREHVSGLPWWWVHGYYRLVLPPLGWDFETYKEHVPYGQGSRIAREARYCRADSCVYVESMEGKDAYQLSVFLNP